MTIRNYAYVAAALCAAALCINACTVQLESENIGQLRQAYEECGVDECENDEICCNDVCTVVST